MYCNNCGREIRENELFCPACGKENSPLDVFEIKAEPIHEVTYTEEEKSRDRRCGLGKAITGAALALVSFFVSYIGFVVSAVMSITYEVSPAGIIFCLGGLAISIISIVFGAKSIGTFKRLSNEGRAKPIATLIIGIESLVSGIAMTFLAVVFSLMLLLVAASVG